MIKIIDYGLGNIQAFLNTYQRLGIPAQRVTEPDALVGASHVLLPGVGSFDQAMRLFNASGFREPMEQLVRDGKTKVLGICVGMQILARGSDEGTEQGLGWIPGYVRRIDGLPAAASLPLPHMGWNDVVPSVDCHLFAGLKDLRYYFLHSYYFDCDREDSILATADYGERFSCAVSNGSIYGVQFHPEKSHHWGQALLGNFASL